MASLSQNLTPTEAEFLAVKIMHLVLQHCPIDKCFVCFYKSSKRLKNCLETCNIADDLSGDTFFNNDVFHHLTFPYKDLHALYYNCTSTHSKEFSLFDCNECAPKINEAVGRLVSFWSTTIKIDCIPEYKEFVDELKNIWKNCDTCK